MLITNIANFKINHDMYNKLVALLSKTEESNTCNSHNIHTSSSGLPHHSIHTNVSSLINSWIIDTGATCHICSFLKFLFYSYHSISSITNKLPNGFLVFSKKFRMVRLDENLTIYNVLFVLEFIFNLVSASQLFSYDK